MLGHYELAAYAIMSNHVHVLILPKIVPSRLLQSWKGVTARQANLVLGRTGETFWQAESYDHWVRDEGECVSRIIAGRAHPNGWGRRDESRRCRQSVCATPGRHQLPRLRT